MLITMLLMYEKQNIKSKTQLLCRFIGCYFGQKGLFSSDVFSYESSYLYFHSYFLACSHQFINSPFHYFNQYRLYSLIKQYLVKYQDNGVVILFFPPFNIFRLRLFFLKKNGRSKSLALALVQKSRRKDSHLEYE